jgi:hypothetical protein
MMRLQPPEGINPDVWKREAKRGAYRFWCVNCNQSFPFGHYHLNGCNDPLCRKHHPENYQMIKSKPTGIAKADNYEHVIGGKSLKGANTKLVSRISTGDKNE